MTVHAICYARSTLPVSMVLSGGDPDRRCPIVFLLYLIDMGSRKILVDAGCDDLPGFVLEDRVSPADALRSYGIQPERITDVILTHAHHDHIQGVYHFPNALIHIQEEEYRKGRAYIPPDAQVSLFAEECTVAGCLRVLKIGGHSAGSCIALLDTPESCLVFGGDECYLPICFQRRIPTGACRDPERSREFLEKYSASCYRVLLSHDPEIQTGKLFTIGKE